MRKYLQQLLNVVYNPRMQMTNTILEDIGADIGYNATTTLAGWFGGKIIWVPVEASPSHKIAKVIGYAAFSRLVQGFGGQRVFIPKDANLSLIRRKRQVYDLAKKGLPSSKIGEVLGFTRNQAYNIRRELEDIGLLPMILSPGAVDDPFEEPAED